MAVGRARPFRLRPIGVIFDGQSHNLIPVTRPFPSLLMDGRGLASSNSAIAGTTYADRAPSVTQRIDAKLGIAAQTVVVDTGGSYDIRDDASAAAVYATAKAYAEARLAAGHAAVIISTVPPSDVFDPSDETERLAYNDLLRANADGTWAGVIDLAGDPRLDDYSDLTYYMVDQDHFTDAGAAAAADVAAPVLDAVLAGL